MHGVNTESKKEVYDFVVIGSGIGGLSTALLGKSGKSVLLVERPDG
jgi:phytoene dehydrogenase-like protein